MQSMICSFGKLRSSSADKLSTFSNVKFIFFHQKNSDSIHQTSSISLFNSKHKRQINLARKWKVTAAVTRLPLFVFTSWHVFELREVCVSISCG